jgi:cupin superfamily acireductone dioxygenase involved in methionine salvage
MREELIGLLGLNKEANEQEIIAEVNKMVTDLRGKMGFANAGIINMMRRLGYFTFDEMRQTWFCKPISEEEMRQILS